MKTKYHLPIAIASLALAANSQADIEGDYREHKVSVSLKISTQGDEKFDETKSGYKASAKILTEKISNKQVLEALKEDGVITDIKGWSIVALTKGTEGGLVGFFLTKKDAMPIDISEAFDFEPIGSVEKYSEKFSVDSKDVAKYSSSTYDFGTAFLGIGEIAGLYLDTFCITKIWAKETFKEDDDDFDSENIIQKAQFVNILGEAYMDDDVFAGIVEGKITAGGGKKTDLADDDDE